MSKVFCVNTPPVKPTRHTSHPAAPFGAGITLVVRPRRFEPSPSDRAWAAQDAIGAEARRLDERAMEAEWQGRLEMGIVG